MKLVIPVHLFHEKKLLSDIPRKCILPNKIKALIIFGEMHFLLLSENKFFHEVNIMESFMDFIKAFYQFFFFAAGKNCFKIIYYFTLTKRMENDIMYVYAFNYYHLLKTCHRNSYE